MLDRKLCKTCLQQGLSRSQHLTVVEWSLSRWGRCHGGLVSAVFSLTEIWLEQLLCMGRGCVCGSGYI